MRRLLGIVAVTALIALVAVAASMQGEARFDPPSLDGADVTVPTMPEAQPTPQSTTPPPIPEENPIAEAIVGVILSLIAAVVIGFVLFLVVRTLLRVWAERVPRRDAGRPGDETFAAVVEPEPDTTTPVIRRGIEQALRLIDGHPVPADAIIAAWVGLEESAADAGISRGRSETPAEFTVRIITRRDGAATEARSLLHLYERVRFAGHDATEQDRIAARVALSTIRERWL